MKKFRGKRKDNQEWVEGDLMQHYIHHKGLTIVQGGYVYYEVDPSTVGQYTTVDDKNGNKIFKDDIASTNDGATAMIVVEYRGCFGLMFIDIYKDQLEIIKDNQGLDIYGFMPLHDLRIDDLQIIGNIHDNTDIVK